MTERSPVLIAGAGLAGLTTAFYLTRAGIPVTLLEKRPYAGGRVYSYSHDRTGDFVDNGQHVFLGCCERLIHLLDQAGQNPEEHLQEHLELTFLDRDQNQYDVSESSFLPVPLNLFPLLTGAGFLTLGERFRVSRTMYALKNLPLEEHPELETSTFKSWLTEKGNSQAVLDKFWNIFVLSTLNAPAEQVSASAGIHVFQEGLLSEPGAGRIGVADTGQTPFYIEPLLQQIEKQGGEIKYRERIVEPHIENNSFTGFRTENGDRVKGHTGVMATPPWITRQLIDSIPPLDPLEESLTHFKKAPIVCVNLWLETSVVSDPFLALIDSSLDWVFNRNKLEKRASDTPQHISVVKSGAFEWMKQSNRIILEETREELSEYFEKFDPEKIVETKVTREPGATFIPSPGIEEHRPGPETDLDGLFLAGAWTDTGWPSTMESAVRSGEITARKIEERYMSSSPSHR